MELNETTKMTLFEEIFREFRRACTICGIPFTTNKSNKNICSWICRQKHNKMHARFYSRTRRYFKKLVLPCIVCGFDLATEQHSEKGKKYTLCPNHHSMITRNVKTLEQLLKEKNA